MNVLCTSARYDCTVHMLVPVHILKYLVLSYFSSGEGVTTNGVLWPVSPT